MRLIDTTTLQLIDFSGKNKPPYAILSHTWDQDNEEVLFEDIYRISDWFNKRGARKVFGACSQAAKDGHAFIWIDTCCINKSSSAELSEVINSMFNWYSKSAICYVFLTDVALRSNGSTIDISHCRYFTRGWALQELIAPDCVQFYDSEWQLLGDRVSMLDKLQYTTQLPKDLLIRQVAEVVNFQPESQWTRPSDGRTDPRRGEIDSVFNLQASLDCYSISTRMSWARHRQTSRPEDLAYSLMGLFDVTMPVLYGEGAERAFYRLQVEIIKRTDDQSILAWRTPSNVWDDSFVPRSSLFARCPGEFPSNIEPKRSLDRSRMTFTGGDLNLELLLCPCHLISTEGKVSEGMLGILDCVTEDFLTRPAIFLEKDPRCKNGNEFQRELKTSMWFVGPNWREHMAGAEDVENVFKVRFDLKKAESTRVIIHDPSDYSQGFATPFPPLRTNPIIQPPHRRFRHDMALGHVLNSRGQFIISFDGGDWLNFLILGVLSMIEPQSSNACKPAFGFLVLWGHQHIVKYSQFEGNKPWCKVLRTDNHVSPESRVEEARECYKAMVTGDRDTPSGDSKVILDGATNLAVHARIEEVEFLDWKIHDLKITITENDIAS